MLPGRRSQEATIQQLEARIAETRRQVVIPHHSRIAAELQDLLGLMAKDVPRAREALARLMPRPFQMVPEGDGYRIEGGLQVSLAGTADSAAVPALTGSCSGGKI